MSLIIVLKSPSGPQAGVALPWIAPGKPLEGKLFLVTGGKVTEEIRFASTILNETTNDDDVIKANVVSNKFDIFSEERLGNVLFYSIKIEDVVVLKCQLPNRSYVRCPSAHTQSSA